MDRLVMTGNKIIHTKSSLLDQPIMLDGAMNQLPLTLSKPKYQLSALAALPTFD